VLSDEMPTMRPLTLKAMTWTTVVAAVASALWLAAVESDQGSALRKASTPPERSASARNGARADADPAASRRPDDHAATSQVALR
jgi:hypothetical protein